LKWRTTIISEAQTNRLWLEGFLWDDLEDFNFLHFQMPRTREKTSAEKKEIKNDPKSRWAEDVRKSWNVVGYCTHFKRCYGWRNIISRTIRRADGARMCEKAEIFCWNAVLWHDKLLEIPTIMASQVEMS
jgi:hypothetical protein